MKNLQRLLCFSLAIILCEVAPTTEALAQQSCGHTHKSETFSTELPSILTSAVSQSQAVNSVKTQIENAQGEYYTECSNFCLLNSLNTDTGVSNGCIYAHVSEHTHPDGTTQYTCTSKEYKLENAGNIGSAVGEFVGGGFGSTLKKLGGLAGKIKKITVWSCTETVQFECDCYGGSVETSPSLAPNAGILDPILN